MKRYQRTLSLVASGVLSLVVLSGGIPAQAAENESTAADQNWPWWRGPDRDGVAASDPVPPISWGGDEVGQNNVIWRSPVPGRGHGSPIVLGDHVYLATADEGRQVQSVLCFDRHSGARQWEAVVHEGGFKNKSPRPPNEKASLASSTIATDSERLFINFLNDNAVWTTALDLEGNLLWQQRICDYVLHQGYGSSPAIYQDLVIVSADNKAGGAIAGLDRETGEILWRRERPAKPNYASPVILRADGRDQLVFTGCDLVTSLDPLTGNELWEVEGATTECVTSTVTDGEHVFTSGGYPKNHISAVRADGSGETAWETNTRNYVPSLLQRDGYLYATLDAGVATCIRCDDGREVWKGRLGGTFTSSPVLVGDLIYATNEDGVTFIFRASPESFQLVAENELGDQTYATPAICGGRIYLRTAFFQDDQRQEYLYCIGQ